MYGSGSVGVRRSLGHARLFAATMMAAGILGAVACGGYASEASAPGVSVDAGPSAWPKPVSRDWRSPLDRDHLLVGRIYRVRDGRFIEQRDLVAALSGWVLLGEKHDNADHHLLQAELVREFVGAGKKPAVAFEMFDVDTQKAIDDARTSAPRDAAALAKAVHWEGSGWPAWELYSPIAQQALNAKLPIVATGLSRTKVKAMMTAKKDGAAAAAEEVDEGASLSDEQRAALGEELKKDHCGHLPDAAVPGMIRMQRARDASMANLLVDASKHTHGDAVLIAGTGHTRTDRGAGYDLHMRDLWHPLVSVAFVEVEKGKEDPSRYAERWNADKLPFDYVWFTPRANDDDPCAAFAR